LAVRGWWAAPRGEIQGFLEGAENQGVLLLEENQADLEGDQTPVALGAREFLAVPMGNRVETLAERRMLSIEGI